MGSCAGVTEQPRGFGSKMGSKDQPLVTLPRALLLRIIDYDHHWNLLHTSCQGKTKSQCTGFVFPSHFGLGRGNKR